LSSLDQRASAALTLAPIATAANNRDKEAAMSLYLIQGSYTPQAWANLCKNPEDREQALRGLLERAGGRLLSLYYCFGEQDVVGIMEAPDAATAAAVSIAVTSAGHVKSVQTTVLMTVKEAVEAMKKAGKLSYQPPKG
jgi:uncharacterized protein with GYD domain